MTYPVFLGAIVVTAANRRLRFKEAAGAVGNVDLALGTYYLRGAYATNLITQSENFSATWSLSANCLATANATPSPNGNGAYLLTMTSAALEAHRCRLEPAQAAFHPWSWRQLPVL